MGREGPDEKWTTGEVLGVERTTDPDVDGGWEDWFLRPPGLRWFHFGLGLHSDRARHFSSSFPNVISRGLE